MPSSLRVQHLERGKREGGMEGWTFFPEKGMGWGSTAKARFPLSSLNFFELAFLFVLAFAKVREVIIALEFVRIPVNYFCSSMHAAYYVCGVTSVYPAVAAAEALPEQRGSMSLAREIRDRRIFSDIS